MGRAGKADCGLRLSIKADMQKNRLKAVFLLSKALRSVAGIAIVGAVVIAAVVAIGATVMYPQDYDCDDDYDPESLVTEDGPAIIA